MPKIAPLKSTLDAFLSSLQTPDCHVVVCTVGKLVSGVSGGFIYGHDVYKALKSNLNNSVELWELQCVHPLFGAAKDEKNKKSNSHQHGQDEINTELMDLKTLVQKYERLPDGAIIVFDGFGLLQAVDSVLSNKNYRGRDNIKHLAFLQYPFGVEPDTTESVRELCKAQERKALIKLDHVVGASECTIRMFYDEYHDQMQKVQKTSVIAPIARFSGQIKNKKKYIGQQKSENEIVKFICVSNTVERKNIMLILKAFKLCMDTFASGPKNAAKLRRWNLSIVCNNSGDALYRKRLEKYISDNDLPVVWLGEQRSPKAMAECYLAHDVFIHASDVENYCMAASEAVCCGCIIVSTQVGELLTISMSNNLNTENNTEKKNSWLYEPKNLEQLRHILILLLRIDDQKKDDSSLLLNASKDAIEYATDIDAGKFTDVFNTEKTFQKKWNDTISLHGGVENNEDFSKGPNPQSIRWSHYYYLMLTLLSGYFALHYQFRRLGNPNTYVRGRLNPVQGQDFHVQAATKVWLLFAVTSHIDMYIFRQSGCIRLLPHIIHHAARVALYYMMFIFPGSPEGWTAAVRFNYYNFWLSSSILTFGLGRDTGRWGCLSKLRIRRPFWWRHLDLVFYFALIPQRILMYVYVHQFNDSSWVPDLAWLGILMTVIEVGNAANKLVFWYSFGANRSKKKNSKALTHEKTD